VHNATQSANVATFDVTFVAMSDWRGRNHAPSWYCPNSATQSSAVLAPRREMVWEMNTSFWVPLYNKTMHSSSAQHGVANCTPGMQAGYIGNARQTYAYSTEHIIWDTG